MEDIDILRNWVKMFHLTMQDTHQNLLFESEYHLNITNNNYKLPPEIGSKMHKSIKFMYLNLEKININF